MENMQELLIKVYDQLPADQKRLKWQFDPITGIYSVNIMGLKIEVILIDKVVYVRTPLTNWQLIGEANYLEEAKAKALETVAKQLSMLSHHIATLGNNFEQL